MGALCGASPRVTYEGQAAIELEAIASANERGAYEMPLAAGTDGAKVLDPRPMLREILSDLAADIAPALVAARFHNTVAATTAAACSRLAGPLGTETAVLSGGVFQNRRLLEQTAALIEDAGLRPLVPKRTPPNDGGISFGQAAVAAALCRE